MSDGNSATMGRRTPKPANHPHQAPKRQAPKAVSETAERAAKRRQIEELEHIAPGDKQDYPTASMDRYVPEGLKPSQMLHDNKGWYAWEKNMIRLFAAHGVLQIMHDAIDQDRAHERRTNHILHHGGQSDNRITGAEHAESAKLDIWDESHDMTLLLRADALIDESIGLKAHARVVGINNVHTKWFLLKQWATAHERYQIFTFTDRLAQLKLKSKSVEDVAVYIDRFTEMRAHLISITGLDDWEKFDFRGLEDVRMFADGAAEHFPRWAKGTMSSIDQATEHEDDDPTENGYDSFIWHAKMLRMAAEEVKLRAGRAATRGQD